MAPDSHLYGRQLGEQHTRFQRFLLKTTLPVCLGLTILSSSMADARTEPHRDSWNPPVASLVAPQKSPATGAPGMASLSPQSLFSHPSPAGQHWSSRNQITIPNHPAIEKHIRFYQGKGRTTFSTALDRSCPYLPIMADILESFGVPAEMVAVVMVESCFKRQASYKGAGGYWQLLTSTARSMGLRVDRWVDERRDPVKSTQAAARYLRSLYNQFRSWPMALAAYNAGEGPVLSASRRHGTSDFWDLSRRGVLPARTQSYVPKVLAAARIMCDLKSYGFESPQPSPLYDFEALTVRTPLKLEQVARWIDMPVSDLKDLNPSLRLDRLPPDGGVHLRLPSGARDKFDLAYEDYLRN